MTSNFNALIKKPQDFTIEEISAWDRFLNQDPRYNSAFYTYEFTLNASKAYPDVFVCIIKNQDQICCFFPFQFPNKTAKFFKAAERVGEEMNDYFGLIADQGFSLSHEQLLALTGLNYFYFSHLDEWQNDFGLKGESPTLGLRIDLSEGPDAYFKILEQNHKSLTQDSRRREKKATAKYGTLNFTFKNNDPQELEKLIQSKTDQYLRTKQKNHFNDKRIDLIRNSYANPQNDFEPILSTLYFGDIWAASHFGMMRDHVLHYWLPVYNIDLNSFSPGRILLSKIISSSHENDLKMIDRGAGDTPYKREFANAEHQYVKGIWKAQSSILGILYSGGMSLKWKCSKK